MTRIKTIALAAALAVAGGTALTGTARADSFWDRFQNQQNRIEQGEDNGSLTRGEAHKLEGQEQQLRRERERLQQGGLSQNERERLQRDLNRQSNAIYDQRHDDQRNENRHDRWSSDHNDNHGWWWDHR